MHTPEALKGISVARLYSSDCQHRQKGCRAAKSNRLGSAGTCDSLLGASFNFSRQNSRKSKAHPFWPDILLFRRAVINDNLQKSRHISWIETLIGNRQLRKGRTVSFASENPGAQR
jgi:hypothetical protein